MHDNSARAPTRNTEDTFVHVAQDYYWTKTCVRCQGYSHIGSHSSLFVEDQLYLLFIDLPFINTWIDFIYSSSLFP